MNNLLKKSLAFVIAATSLVSTTVFADFPDMPTDESRTAMENAVKNGLLSGFENGEIRPYTYITRAQMATILVRAMDAQETADITNFGDVKKGDWYYEAMSKAVAIGIFQGDGENLNPNNNISFQEAFAVIARTFDLQSSRDIDELKVAYGIYREMPTYTSDSLDVFVDRDSISDWAKPTARAIVEGGYWTGKDGYLRPGDPVNRAEFAMIMDNVIKTYIDEDGTYDNLPVGNVLVRADKVTIDNLTGEKTCVLTGYSAPSNLTLGKNVNIDKLVTFSGSAYVSGTYNQIRMLGQNSYTNISGLSDGSLIVKMQVYGKYANSKFDMGVQEISQ